MSPRRKDLETDFIHATIARAGSRGGGEATRYALQRFGLNLETSTEQTTVGGEFKSESLAFFESVSEQSVVGQLPLRQVPFDARLVSVPTGVTAYWKPESAGKALGQMSLSAASLAARKVAALVAFSDEVLRDTDEAGVTLVRNDLIRA